MKTKIFYCILILLLIGMGSSGQEVKKIDPPMVLIPGGEFTMGKDSEPVREYSPAHKIKVASFYMDRHEVTNGEYFEFCKETGYRLPEFWNSDSFRSGEKYPNYPVVGINWLDAVSYAKWAGKRLPTEAEWEYAARGRLENANFPNGNDWTKEAAKQDAGSWKNLIDPVESYEPNGFGTYDMGGNVWEWVSDSYFYGYHMESETNTPEGPGKSKHKVIRGGGWHSGEMCKKVFYRNGLSLNWCDFAVGFRCVKDLEPKKIAK